MRKSFRLGPLYVMKIHVGCVYLCVSGKVKTSLMLGIIKTYLTLFAVFFIGYSFLNLLLTTKTDLIKIDKDYSNFGYHFLLFIYRHFSFLDRLLKNHLSDEKQRTVYFGQYYLFQLASRQPFHNNTLKTSATRL
jgi:hypothetical protein